MMPPTSVGGDVNVIRDSLVPVPRVVPVKLTVAPKLVARLPKVKVGLPAVLRVTLMVEAPEASGQCAQCLDRAGGIVEAAEIDRATGQIDGRAVAAVPKRLAVYPPVTLSSMVKVPARLMVIVSVEVMLGAVKPPLEAKGLPAMRSVPPSTLMLPSKVLPRRY